VSNTRETIHKIGTETKTKWFLAIIALAMLLSTALVFAATPIADAATDYKGVTPFMIYGNISYGNGTPCTNPDIRITNLDTGIEWQAETSDGDNHYQIVLRSDTDLNVSETLHFNVTDGTSPNTVDHTITGNEVWAGGLFGFDLILEPVEVSIADASVDLFGKVTIPIMITNIEDYGTGTIDIEYDPSVVHVTDVTSSSDSSVTAKNINNTIGLAKISAWNIDGVSGDIIFANVSFASVGVGSTPLILDVVTLQNISYTEITPRTISNGSFRTTWGDVNEDGQLTTADAVIVLQMAVRGEYLKEADVNGDSHVTSVDALMIQQMLVINDE
jgi:hypothetical protein